MPLFNAIGQPDDDAVPLQLRLWACSTFREVRVRKVFSRPVVKDLGSFDHLIGSATVSRWRELVWILSKITRPIFAIFEGGGAKGVAHVGAIAAAEANGLTFVGVAGASAGAIVATLVAVGFQAKDLIDPDQSGGDILTRYGKTPVGLLGSRQWKRLRRLLWGGKWLLISVGTTGLIGGAVLAWCLEKTALGMGLNKGHLSTDGVREFLNQVLREKLTSIRAAHGITDPLPERITFRDLDDERFDEVRPLKIVGSNTTTRELWIFDRRLTPDVEVAQAVAASIAIPFAFRPVVIDGDAKPHRFVDGGMVSNLPVWVFANEKLAYERDNYMKPPVPIIGFTLREKPKPLKQRNSARPLKHKDGLSSFLADLLQTSLAGSQAISQNFIQDLTVVALETSLDMLDFDASEERMFEAYKEGYECADRQLGHAIIAKPDLVRGELKRIHDKVRAALRAAWPGRKGRWILRANLVERSAEETFRVTYGYNMDKDADDRLPLDGRGRGAPLAYKERDMTFAPVGAAWLQPGRDHMTKYERALLRRGIRSIVCIPIFRDEDTWLKPPAERPEPAGVLSIDSDRDLSGVFKDDEFRWLLATQSTLLFDVVTREPERG